ncbi:MAG: sugar ABC transporter permease [Firmicutes bacterium]|nr:sugar ABC transporter permease [Bacillota bacterium]
MAQSELQKTLKAKARKETKKNLKNNWILYIFLLPAVVYIGMFHYGPMYGLILAFKNYKGALGIMGSPWVGTRWFTTFFKSPLFSRLIRNTLIISFYQLIVGFPMPIILAIMLNYINNVFFKKFAQTLTYIPYFISTVILVSMMTLFFSPNSGFINTIIKSITGMKDGIYFMGTSKYFRHMYVWSGVWQGTGYSAVIYIAALAGVSMELHEAAIIDGASIWKRIWHIDIPSIMPTIVILLVMQCGSIINVGYEKVLLMQNQLNRDVSEVISTYVYNVSFPRDGSAPNYGYSTAIGLLNNVINFIILIIANTVANKLTGSGLW